MTPKTNTDISEEAAQDTHSAELTGGKVKVLHDFQRRVMLEEKPLLVVDKYGRDVRESMKDWHFAWFDETDLLKFTRVGYEVVDPRSVEVDVPAMHDKARADHPDRMTLNELTLCRIPTVDFEAWNAYIEQTRNRASEAILEDTADEKVREHSDGIMAGADRGYGGIKSKRG